MAEVSQMNKKKIEERILYLTPEQINEVNKYDKMREKNSNW